MRKIMKVLEVKLLCICFVLLMAGLANALPITNVSYKEKESYFDWKFNWDRSLPGSTSLDYPAAQNYWLSGVRFNCLGTDNIYNDVDFFSRHITGPHNLDVNPAPWVHLWVDNINALEVTNGWLELRIGSVEHLHTPDNHKDIYKLYYNNTGSGEIQFQYHGVHVPEPATMLLLGLGLIGLAGVRRKVRK